MTHATNRCPGLSQRETRRALGDCVRRGSIKDGEGEVKAGADVHVEKRKDERETEDDKDLATTNGKKICGRRWSGRLFPDVRSRSRTLKLALIRSGSYRQREPATERNGKKRGPEGEASDPS